MIRNPVKAELMAKRIIGLAGDHLQLRGVKVKGSVLENGYKIYMGRTSGAPFASKLPISRTDSFLEDLGRLWLRGVTGDNL